MVNSNSLTAGMRFRFFSGKFSCGFLTVLLSVNSLFAGAGYSGPGLDIDEDDNALRSELIEKLIRIGSGISSNKGCINIEARLHADSLGKIVGAEMKVNTITPEKQAETTPVVAPKATVKQNRSRQAVKKPGPDTDAPPEPEPEKETQGDKPGNLPPSLPPQESGIDWRFFITVMFMPVLLLYLNKRWGANK
ncbi:MAG: hypothetical protein IPK76_04805 [Lewinellaceae bacterium]|nr:hypothetical protein [Lewinellaceae bacterium]